MTTIFASPAIDGLPSDYSVPSEPVCEASSAPVTAVGQIRLSHIEPDPDDGCAYFDAQGRIRRRTLGGRGA
jgi:hypothetical protein